MTVDRLLLTPPEKPLPAHCDEDDCTRDAVAWARDSLLELWYPVCRIHAHTASQSMRAIAVLP